MLRFVHDHPMLCLNVVFLAAGASAAVISELAYRIACVVIVLAIRAIWAQATIQRAYKRTEKKGADTALSAVERHLLRRHQP